MKYSQGLKKGQVVEYWQVQTGFWQLCLELRMHTYIECDTKIVTISSGSTTYRTETVFQKQTELVNALTL